MKPYRATPSKWEETSWNVVDMTRRNQWGELVVVLALVTEDEAKNEAKRLNERS